MELKWLSDGVATYALMYGGNRDRRERVASIGQRTDDTWSITLSYNIAPMELDYKSRYATEQEAKEATENLVRVLIIGGHHRGH
jgi:hypothetical protein